MEGRMRQLRFAPTGTIKASGGSARFERVKGLARERRAG